MHYNEDRAFVFDLDLDHTLSMLLRLNFAPTRTLTQSHLHLDLPETANKFYFLQEFTKKHFNKIVNGQY